jgi:hypothetical protein
VKQLTNRLRKLEAEACLTARPGEIREKSLHVLRLVGGEGPPREPIVSRTLYSTGWLFERVIIDERDPLLTDKAALERFVATFPINPVEVVSWSRPRR